MWLNRVHCGQNRTSRLNEKKVLQVFYYRKQLRLEWTYNWSEIGINYSNCEILFRQQFNWFWLMSHYWFKTERSKTHQFEDVNNTQTRQAIRKEDDEHWERVFEQISISFRNEKWLYEVTWNMRRFVNMWTIWIHIQNTTCEDDTLKTKMKFKKSSRKIYQKNWNRKWQQHTVSKKYEIQYINIWIKSRMKIWNFELFSIMI